MNGIVKDLGKKEVYNNTFSCVTFFIVTDYIFRADLASSRHFKENFIRDLKQSSNFHNIMH